MLPTVFETDPIQAIRILRPAARDVWVSLEPVFEAIRHDVAWRVVTRDGLVVSGPGALDWLQGQVS